MIPLFNLKIINKILKIFKFNLFSSRKKKKKSEFSAIASIKNSMINAKKITFPNLLHKYFRIKN
jgi:hypothetical protein